MTLSDDMRNGVKKPEMPTNISGERYVLERVNPHRGTHIDFFKEAHSDNFMRRQDFARNLGIKLAHPDNPEEIQNNLLRMDSTWQSYGFGTYVVIDTQSAKCVGAARIGYDSSTSDIHPRLSIQLTDKRLSQYVKSSREAKSEIGFLLVKAATEKGIRVHCTDSEVARDIGMQEIGNVWANPYFDTSRKSHRSPESKIS